MNLRDSYGVIDLLFKYRVIKKMLVTFHEQQRILQFNNQNLHSTKIIRIIILCNMFCENIMKKNYIFLF